MRLASRVHNQRYNGLVGGVAMRIAGLLVVLLLILIFFLAAPAASYAQTAPSVKPAVSTDGKDAPTRAFQNFLRGDGTQLQMDGVCFTMRTYVVAREDKDSDVTRPVRVTRCLPATKLEFKSAMAPERSEDDSARER
jgi:hypothetical protein